MKYLLYIILAIAIISFASCIPEPLEVEIEDLDPQVVVFSQVIPYNFMTIVLTQTIAALDFSQDEGDTVSQNFLENFLVSDAEITVSYRDVVDTLYPVSDGLYISAQTPQYINENYSLKIVTEDGEILTSESIMLPLVEFTEVTPVIERTEEDTIISVQYEITDLQERNWYVLNFYTQGVESDSGTGLDLNSFFDEEDNVLKATELISDEIIVDGLYKGEVILEDILVTDSLVVTLSNISEDYYKFLEVRKSAGSFFTELTKEPISSPTNINGGLGFFNTHYPDVHFFDLNDF